MEASEGKELAATGRVGYGATMMRDGGVRKPGGWYGRSNGMLVRQDAV